MLFFAQDTLTTCIEFEVADYSLEKMLGRRKRLPPADARKKKSKFPPQRLVKVNQKLAEHMAVRLPGPPVRGIGHPTEPLDRPPGAGQGVRRPGHAGAVRSGFLVG